MNCPDTVAIFRTKPVAAPSDTGREQPDKKCPCGCGQIAVECAPTPESHEADDCTCEHCTPGVAPAQAQPELLTAVKHFIAVRGTHVGKDCNFDNPATYCSLCDKSYIAAEAELDKAVARAELRASDPQKGQGWVSVRREDLESIARKGHNQVCPVCRNGKYDGHKTTCWLSNALIGRAAPPPVPAGSQEEKK